MNKKELKKQIEHLKLHAEGSASINEYYESLKFSRYAFQGTLSLIIFLYGKNSLQVEQFTKEIEEIRNLSGENGEEYVPRHIGYVTLAKLMSVEDDIKLGLTENLRTKIAGEVLTDFLQLSRTALEEKGNDTKNVAAVLAAALFEDTIRRLAIANGIPHLEKLADVLKELKDKGIIQGTQVGIAQSYLSFRNNALHAQWEKVEKESVASVLGFVEQLLMKNFS